MTETLHKFFPGNSRERIQDLLRDRGMSQAELAEKIGMSESSLSRYLSGQTDKLSTDNIVSIARVFEVTTDFLLCLTDIPFTTNYDIEKLGLSVKAAENMLKKKVDMGALNSLLVMPAFALLTQKLEQMRQGTFAAGLGSMKAVFTGAQDLLMEYAQNHPEDRRAAKQAIEEIRALQPVSAFELDTAEAEAIFRGIMQEFRASAKEYVEKAAELTSTVMKRVLAKAHSQMKSPEKFRGFTPEMMVDSIIGSVPQLDLENEHVKVLHDALLPLFTRPQDLIKQRKENVSGSEPSETKT